MNLFLIGNEKNIYYFLYKMRISEIKTLSPIIKSKNQNKFCLILLEEPFKIHLKTRFKIYEHEDSFFVGIDIPEDQLSFFEDLEEKLNTLAMENKQEVQKLYKTFRKYSHGDFRVIKTDKSEKKKTRYTPSFGKTREDLLLLFGEKLTKDLE